MAIVDQKVENVDALEKEKREKRKNEKEKDNQYKLKRPMANTIALMNVKQKSPGTLVSTSTNYIRTVGRRHTTDLMPISVLNSVFFC